jgi:hypothetical protein
VDDQAIRAAALLIAAIVHSGGEIVPQSTLVTYAQPLIPVITGGGPAAQMTLSIKGDHMPLTIDSKNSVAVLEFEDRAGTKVAPPAGTLATATSSDPAVLGVGAATAGTDANGVPVIQFPLTEVAAGTSILSVHATDAGGNPLLGPDGTTPIPDPPPVTVTVAPGLPAAEVFTVAGN